MGVVPGSTSGVAIIGVHERTIYRDYPGKIIHNEAFDITGNLTSQVFEIMTVLSEFWPCALVVESFNSKKPIANQGCLDPVRVGARIEMCVESHYTLAPLFWQTPVIALDTAPDNNLKLWGIYEPEPDHIRNATRHAITFIRRAKEASRHGDWDLIDKAWGPPENYRPDGPTRRRGIKRSRRALY